MTIRLWYNSFYGQERLSQDFEQSTISIGRLPSNDLQLDHPQVPDQAATLLRNGDGMLVRAESFDWVEVANKRLARGETAAVDPRELIRIFPYTISYTGVDDSRSQRSKWELLDEQLANFLRELHRQLLDLIGGQDMDRESLRDVEAMRRFERDVEGIAESLGFFAPEKSELLNHAAGHAVRNCFLLLAGENEADEGAFNSNAWTESTEEISLVSIIPERELELTRLGKSLKSKADEQLAAAAADEKSAGPKPKLNALYWPLWDASISQLRPDSLRYLGTKNIKKEIKDTVFGYGPLEDLLRTPAVTEIMVVNSEKIYVERDGDLEDAGRRFVSDEVTESIIQRIVGRVGKRIDRSQPLVDARLTDGSRVNAVIPPIAVQGPCLTIRKFAARKFGVKDLIKFGSLTETVAMFLDASVKLGANILVSGGTGTGKTTLLNCLSDYIPNDERIITIEDTAELKLKKDHVVSLETKEKNVEQTGEYTIRDLVKNALRMRPNRIIVGECRGPEALDMLQAMNTGHSGSMTTIHANTAQDAVSRLEVLVGMDKDTQLPVESIREQIVAAIDLIVQLKRIGKLRLVIQVAEVIEIDPVTKRIRTKDIFRAVPRMRSSDADADETEDHLALCPTGQLPTFMGKLIENGYLNLDTFY